MNQRDHSGKQLLVIFLADVGWLAQYNDMISLPSRKRHARQKAAALAAYHMPGLILRRAWCGASIRFPSSSPIYTSMRDACRFQLF
eukprot:CAMPEP_0204525004 /NCGR_PEP_ID=MMETSP0661-20131031/7676_1 /ASSEMBLY_ACC=CAM_ASM_000606 /TAXON_ID=109239 /ORGANISM="Alexandrium margalefi, Strain AMGDE01CS-322" /LENGTH=85 /DNA_ID=CAMNT_0051530781 /DNA_START=29 /DNA_END=286 /DNA_ORIENTATION=-